MSNCPEIRRLLVLPRLRVQNANAISSPLTHGFPSITAFLGLMWALERKASASGLEIAFDAVGVVCHDHDEQVTKEGFVRTFRLTRNPVDKDGSTAAIVEEGRIHLELSLVFAVRCERWEREPDDVARDAATLAAFVAGMRIAGGSVLPNMHNASRRNDPYVIALTGTEDDQRKLFRQMRYRLLPGFALVARDDLLDARFAELQQRDVPASRLDAWLSLSRSNWRFDATQDREINTGRWRSDRTGRGWIVPIPVGYGALAEVQPPGRVANARDTTTPFCFVESLYSIGEWVSPHRLASPEQLLWYTDSRPDDGLYRCRNDYQPARDAADFIIDTE